MKDSQINIVIPMKDPADAKQRLRPALADQERAELALELFENTLGFFSFRFPELHLLVVTHSPRIRDITDRYGHTVLFEPDKAGLNTALERATEWSKRHGYQQQLVLPADIASLNADEVQQLLDSKRHGVTIVPAKDGGTNALLTSPPDAIPFCFGQDSAEQHMLASRQRDIHYQQLTLPQLSHDIDQPEDLLNYRPTRLPTEGVANYV